MRWSRFSGVEREVPLLTTIPSWRLPYTRNSASRLYAVHQGENLMKSNGAGQLTRSPIHLLHRASQVVEEIFTAEIEIDRLTPRQLAVLMTVAQNEGLSQTGIVDRTGIDRSTLADIVRRLQGEGYCSAGVPRRMRAPTP